MDFKHELARELSKYIKELHTQEECTGFIAGFEKAIELLSGPIRLNTELQWTSSSEKGKKIPCSLTDISTLEHSKPKDFIVVGACAMSNPELLEQIELLRLNHEVVVMSNDDLDIDNITKELSNIGIDAILPNQQIKVLDLTPSTVYDLPKEKKKSHKRPYKYHK